MVKDTIIRRSTTRGTVRAKRLLLEPLEPRVVLAAGSAVISEFLAVNDGTTSPAWVDGDGDTSDWIEIYNPVDARADLGGWYLTDDADDLTKWQFPDVSIEPGEYIVVFASGKTVDASGNPWPADELHATFQLDGDKDVDTDDIFAILATGQWGDFTPYYPESGKASAAKGEADAVVDLIVNPETGEVCVDTNGVEITGYLISSDSGALSGEAATQFTLSEQSADQIADMLPLGKAFDGVHDLGSVLEGDGSDWTLTYTLAGQAGVFQGSVKVVPEPGTLAMLLVGGLGLLLLAVRRRK